MTWQILNEIQPSKFAKPPKIARIVLDILVSYFFLLDLSHRISFWQKGVDEYVFAVAGYYHESYPPYSTIERFNAKHKNWKTLKIELPKKLSHLCAIVTKDGMVHFVGGRNAKSHATDSLMSIPLKELLPKDVGFLVFSNWLRKSGIKWDGKDVGGIVNNFVGAMDIIP